MTNDDTSQARHWLQAGDWAFIVVVVAAYLSLFVQTSVAFEPTQAAVLLILGLVYTAIGTYLFETQISAAPPGVKWLYFAVQLILATVILWLSRLAGAVWLLLLPLVGHSLATLSIPGAIAVSALVMAAFGAPIALTQGWQVGLTALLSFAPGVAFIAIFTQITLSEARARDEVEKLAGDLQTAYEALARYAVQAEELAMEKERTRLAREIHDSLGHYLTAIHMQLETARAVQDADMTKLSTILERAQALTKEGLQEVRRSVATLRASPLEGRSLETLIDMLVAGCRAADIEADFIVAGTPRPLPPQVELALYRVAQEALTNVRKHSQAQRVEVTLTYTDTDVSLQVRDDGIGATAPEGGFGLIGLRERVQLLGGTLSISSMPGQGFLLDVAFEGVT